MFEDIPILSINTRIWTIFSIIESHTWRRYIFVVPVALMNVFQFIFLYENNDDVTMLILNAFYTAAIFDSVLRTCFVIKNRSGFENFMTELADMYMDIEENDDEVEREILRNATKGARNISIFNLTASLLDLIGAVIYPLFSSERVHPFGVVIPGTDVILSPTYEIIYIFQLTCPISLTLLYMPFVNLFASYAMFGKAALKIVQVRIGRIYTPLKNEWEMYKDLISCIQYYTRIARYVEALNSLMTYMVLIEFIVFVTIHCALIFCLNIIDSAMLTIAVIMYIITMFYVLFTYYWQASQLLAESVQVSEAVYDIEWYECSQFFKKTLLFFIMKTRKPLMIKIGNVYPMTMEMFQFLLNVTYSCFTLLRSAYK